MTPRVGYRLVLPPGWARIPLREDTDAAITAILDDSLAQLGDNLPREKINPLRAELTKRLREQAQVARENEGIDLYLPVARRGGKTIGASFVVGLMRFDSVESPDAEDVLFALAARSDDARMASVDSAPAVRTEEVAAQSAQFAVDQQQYGSRRVTYVVAVPGELDTWLSSSFSTIGDGDPDGEVAHVLVELFDAIMSTWRWVESD